MKLKVRAIRDLAQMITGGSGSSSLTGASVPKTKWDIFPYRSTSALTDFFIDCDLEHRHTGGSRVPWTQDVLAELNEGPSSKPQLPADALVRVIEHLLDPAHFLGRREPEKERVACLEVLNEVLEREELRAYLDGAGLCHLRAGQITSAGLNVDKRAWSQKDLEHKRKWERYLEGASEDDFTEFVLVPLFQQCGFYRISVAGHKDKALEYGKDIWMKLQLPTSHFIYFGVQVKKGKIDAAGRSKTDHENIAEVLNQVQMAMSHPVLDTEINKRVLVDHVYIVASGEITKQAKQFLAEKLDMEGRRRIIFMDREDILTLAVQIGMPLPSEKDLTDDIPF